MDAMHGGDSANTKAGAQDSLGEPSTDTGDMTLSNLIVLIVSVTLITLLLAILIFVSMQVAFSAHF